MWENRKQNQVGDKGEAFSHGLFAGTGIRRVWCQGPFRGDG